MNYNMEYLTPPEGDHRVFWLILFITALAGCVKLMTVSSKGGRDNNRRELE